MFSYYRPYYYRILLPSAVRTHSAYRNVFPYSRMCSLAIECVLLLQALLLQNTTAECGQNPLAYRNVFPYSRMCSLAIECVLLLQAFLRSEPTVLTEMCSCFVFFFQSPPFLCNFYLNPPPVFVRSMFSYCRMCSLLVECVLLL